MRFDSEKYRRQSIRLKGYDYTQVGAYFVTMVAHDRSLQFGEIADGEMQLRDAGRIVRVIWEKLPAFYPGVEIDEFVVMPNHFHGIVVLVGVGPGAYPPGPSDQPRSAATTREPAMESGGGQAQGPAPTDVKRMSVGDVVSRFKTMTTKRYADGVRDLGWPAFAGRLWQRNYYEHVVRDDAELDRIRQYIGSNPSRWAEDEENPLKAQQ